MRRADGPITPPVSRCTACGSWVWRIDTYGCPTCIHLWARFGVVSEPRDDDEEKP